MDKRIREILKANEKLDMWQVRGQALSPSWTKQWDGRKEESIKERGRKRESFRERYSTFSLNFPDDRTDGFRRSKRKISTSRQGLRIETEVGEF